MTNTGWICPKCGRCYAPSVSECSVCNTTPAPSVPASPYPWPQWSTCQLCGQLFYGYHVCFAHRDHRRDPMTTIAVRQDGMGQYTEIE